MVPPTERQRFVLANLERVKPKPYKLEICNPQKRYELDGKDCTQPINSLIVRGFVAESGTVLSRREVRPARQPAMIFATRRSFAASF